MLFIESSWSRFWLSPSETRHKLAVMMLDLDNSKNVNDTLGHIGGPIQCLKEVGFAYLVFCAKNDTVASLGGDEFIVLLSDWNGMERCDSSCRNNF